MDFGFLWEIRFSTSNSDEYFPRNAQMKSKYDCDALIPADTSIDTLALTYEKADYGKFKLSSVYIGSGSAVMWQHFMDAAVTMGIAFLFVLLGVIAVGVSVYLHSNRIDGRRFLDTAGFLFICSIWFVTDSSITQVQLGNAPIVCVISFYAFMLLAVPMLHFVKHTGEMEKYRVLDWLTWLFYFNAMMQGLLHKMLKIEFKDMLAVTHLLLLAGVGISVGITVMYLTIGNPSTYMDHMTGVFGKHYFGKWFQEQLLKGNHIHVISIDAIRLKQINKIFGNSVGDQLLLRITEELQQISDTVEVFRMSGKRFFLVMQTLVDYE